MAVSRHAPSSILLRYFENKNLHEVGQALGETNDFAYNIVKDGVHVHDFHATMLHCLGINHTKLTYRFEGRDYRLTDVAGEVVKQLLA